MLRRRKCPARLHRSRFVDAFARFHLFMARSVDCCMRAFCRRLVLAAPIFLVGCAMWRPAVVPMRSVIEPAACSAPVSTLLVMLPGSYSRPQEFQSEGFVKIARRHHMAADLLLVDAHVRYYQNRSIIDRLAEDVIRPARLRGYRQIWLVGISIGAVGAMLFADAHPGDVDGVVLLAPYLGTALTAQEIKRAGGLDRWPAPENTPGDLDTLLWRWLQGQTSIESKGIKVPLFLGYGDNDRFRYSAEVLRSALPSSRVFTASGGHDWSAWRGVWNQIADVVPIPVDSSCADD